MAIRTSKIFYFRFAILALLAGFSFDVFAGYAIANNGWVTPAGACYGSVSEACQNVIPPSNATVYVNGTTSGNSCVTYQLSNNTQVGAVLVSAASCTACPSGQLRIDGQCTNTPTCTGGRVFDTNLNECTWPTSCPPGQSLFNQTTAQGKIVSSSCFPNVPTPTQKCISYDDMQTAYCQNQSNTCTASGGTFGNVNGVNVCIPAGTGGPMPTCASGSSQFVTNPDGSSTPTCVGTSNIGNTGVAGGGGTPLPQGVIGGAPTTQSTTISDANIQNNTAEIARISAGGFQAIVNAINTNTTKTSGGGGGGTQQVDMSGVISAINNLDSDVKGANNCDPRKSDYQKCLGNLQQATDETAKMGDAQNTGDTTLDTAKQSALDSIANRTAPDDGTTNSQGLISQIFNTSFSCSDMDVSLPYSSHFSITCSGTAKIREWMGFALAVITLLACYDLAFRRTA